MTAHGPHSLSRRSFLGLTAAGLAWSAPAMRAAAALAVEKSAELPPLPTRAGNVNATDIRAAVELGCRTMSRTFNADDHDIPFFNTHVWPEPGLYFSRSHSEAHVPGRHLNALLSAESVLGVAIAEAAVEKHAEAAFFSFSGPIALPLNREAIGGSLRRCQPHNIREGLHAMYALARFRHSARAREVAERCIETCRKYWSPDRGWDRAYIEKDLGLYYSDGAGGSPFINGIARAMGPLVKYYRATRYRPALDLAIVLKEKALAEFFLDDGAYVPARHGIHTHSITCVLSSLAQLYEVTGEARILDRVHGFFGNGLKDLSDDIGWAVELTNNTANPDRGEANSTGDIVEACLILGANGRPAYFGHAERILRSHLLPCQLRDVSFVPTPPNPTHEDGKRDVADRHLGAFGFPAPYGHKPVEATDLSFNLDIVGGAVGSLCEAYRNVAVTDDRGHRVNLLFDHENESLKIAAPYPHGILAVTVKRAAPLSLRIPAWVDRATMRVNLPPASWRWDDAFLHVSLPPVNEPVTVAFALPEQDLALRHRTRTIRARLRGDAVEAMDNFGAPLAYFAPLA